MSDSRDVGVWLRNAQENPQVADLAFGAGLFNPCLYNVQQAVEKALKAVIVSRDQDVIRTHRIVELSDQLRTMGISTGLTDEEIELLDSIFRPTRYPPDSALPESMPDKDTSMQFLEIARRVLAWARHSLNLE